MSCFVLPALTVAELLVISMSSTLTLLFTFTVQVALYPPSSETAVILQLPFFFAVTTPLEETVAIDLSDVLYVSPLFEAFDGEKVTESDFFCPT